MTHLPTFPLPPEARAAPAFRGPRSVELGLRNGTLEAGTWRVEITMSDEVFPARARRRNKPKKPRPTADIHAVRLHGRLALSAPDRAALSEAGIAAPACAPATVAVPRALWRGLPGGRCALRLRVRARARLKDGRLAIEAEALHLFPAEGCRSL